MAIEIALLGYLGYQVNKSMNIDEQAVKKNIKAFTMTAETQNKLEKCQADLLSKMLVNAKRKNGILTGHLQLFKEQYSMIRKIDFREGKGIEELHKIDEIQDKLNQYMTMPAVSTGKIMTNTQLMVAFVLKGGIGGLMIQDSEMNLKLASRNLSQANAVAAQIDSICIAMDGITKHIEIVTELLEQMGMLYMKSVRNLSDILKRNGTNKDLYTEQDINQINMSLKLTKFVYKIINASLIDEKGQIEKASLDVIDEGRKLLNSIIEKEGKM